MDPNKLVEVAIGAVVGALTKAAAEPVMAAGRKVWDWAKGKLGGADAATAAAVEADPAKPSTPAKVTALLQDLLHDNPAAVDELRALLGGEAGVQAITQTLTISGANAKVAQTAGDNNKVSIR